MYLEISGRMTGKTPRLCNAVIEHLLKDKSNRAIIVCMNGIMVNLISDYLIERVEEWKITLCIYDVAKYINPRITNARVFYDEFDFVRPEQKFYYDPDGYYSTTLGYRHHAHNILKMNDNIYMEYKRSNDGFIIEGGCTLYKPKIKIEYEEFRDVAELFDIEDL